MNPILFCEIQQLKRQLWKLLIFYIVLLSFLRYFFGDTGLLISLFLLSLSLSIAAGTGCFEEEILKKRLNFLYIVPVSPARIWIVKVGFGLTLVFVLLCLLSLFVLIFPAQKNSEQFINYSSINIGSWIFLLLALCLFSFAEGLFCVSFCLRPYFAVLHALLLFFLIPIILFLIHLFWGLLPEIFEFAILLLCTSFSLFLGSFLIFTQRNPFLEQRWKWRKIAALFTLISMAIFALTYESLGIRKRYATNHYYQGIRNFSISPNGKYIYITAWKSPILNNRYFLDAKGNLVTDLGHMYLHRNAREIWPPDDGDNYLIYDESRPVILSEEMNYLPLKLLNLSNRKITDIQNLNLLDNGFRYYYFYISQDGKYLFGKKIKELKHDWITCAIFKQDISTGQIDYFDLKSQNDTRNVSVQFLPKDLAQIKYECQDQYGPGYYASRKKVKATEPNESITLMNLNNFSQKVYTIPKYTEEWEITPEGKTLIALQRIPFENYVEYHVIALDLATQIQTTLLKPPDLPRLDFQDLLKGRSISIDFGISPAGRWIRCDTDPNQSVEIQWLIDWQENKHYKFLEYEKTDWNDTHHMYLSNTIYTKDESRIAVIFSHIRNRNTPIEKEWTQLEIYDWTGNGFDKTYSYELPENYRKFKFLDGNRILFIKPGKPKFPFETDELWVLHFDTGKKHRFFQDNPTP